MDSAAIHRALTDNTFVDWMHSNEMYTIEREELYQEWKRLCRRYRKIEFRVLSERPPAKSRRK